MKVKVYNTVVIPQMLYGAETWALKKDQRRLLTAEMSCLRRIMGVSRLQKIKNDEIRQRLGMEETIVDKVMHKHLQWYGHVVRMKQNRWPQIVMNMKPTGKRSRGRQRIRWLDNINTDLKGCMTLTEASRMAQDREKWKQFLSSYCRRRRGRQR